MKIQKTLLFFMVTALLFALCSCNHDTKKDESNQPVITSEINQTTKSGTPEKADDFVGVWNRTNTNEALTATINITNRKEGSFEFEFNGIYGGNQGFISGTAKITDVNQALFIYKSEYSDQTANVTFIFDNGLLEVSADNNDALGFGQNVTIDGTYTTSNPIYTNTNLVDSVFPTKADKQKANKILGTKAYEQMLLVMRFGIKYSDDKLTYKGFITGAGQGVDIKIVGSYYYFLGYYLDREGQTLYTNDPAYKSSLPDFFSQRDDTTLNFVFKSVL